MPYFPTKPCIQLTCTKLQNRPGCGWEGKFYFDVELPDMCPRCHFAYSYPNHGDRLRRESLPVGEGYNHKEFLRKRRDPLGIRSAS